MREHQLVSLNVNFELVYISSPPKSIACTEKVSYRSDLSQYQCRRGDLRPRCVAAICRIVCLGLESSLRNSQQFSNASLAKVFTWQEFPLILHNFKTRTTFFASATHCSLAFQRTGTVALHLNLRVSYKDLFVHRLKYSSGQQLNDLKRC